VESLQGCEASHVRQVRVPDAREPKVELLQACELQEDSWEGSDCGVG